MQHTFPKMIPFSIPIECTTPRMSFNINYGFEVIRCIKVDSSLVTKVPLCYRMLIAAEAAHVLGQDLHGNSLYFLLHFSMNLKLL